MKELIQLLKEIRPDVDFENNTALIDQGVLDSLDIMEIVAEITDRFDVSISPGRYRAREFQFRSGAVGR